MGSVVVAFGFQIAWICVRVALEHEGIAPTNGSVAGLSVACRVASYTALAVTSGGFARRLRGRRRAGMWIATLGSVALIAGVALYQCLLHRSTNHTHALALALAVRTSGWSIADVVMILGFAIAAGTRGFWLAPPTIGLALLNVQPSVTSSPWSPAILIALLIVKAAFVAFMATAAERDAEPLTPDRDRALAALRRFELCAWAGVALSPIWAVAWSISPTIQVALGSACTNLAVAALFAVAAWSTPRAAIVEFSRWPWHAAAMFSVWGFARTLRVWLLTLNRHWGDLEATPLKASHWWTAIPGVIASLCALGALAVFAYRTRAHETTRAAATAVLFLVVAISIRVVLPGQTLAEVIPSVVANLAAVRAYRVARSAIQGPVPRARLV